MKNIDLKGAAIMGSDFSYEDLTGGKGLLDTYRVTLEGNETVDGHDCYRLKLEAKTRDAVYQLERVWVDKQLFAYRKVVLYSLSGKPVKEMHITDFKKNRRQKYPRSDGNAGSHEKKFQDRFHH